MTDVNIFGRIRGAVRQYFATAQFAVQPMLAAAALQQFAYVRWHEAYLNRG